MYVNEPAAVGGQRFSSNNHESEDTVKEGSPLDRPTPFLKQEASIQDALKTICRGIPWKRPKCLAVDFNGLMMMMLGIMRK